jgi:hypothetical protein
MSAILRAADRLIGRGDPPDLAAELLPAMVRHIHQPFVEEIGVAALDRDRLAEFTAAEGIHPIEAAEERTRPFDDILFALEHDLAHATSRQLRWTPKTGQVAKRESSLGAAGWPEVRLVEYSEEAQS